MKVRTTVVATSALVLCLAATGCGPEGGEDKGPDKKAAASQKADPGTESAGGTGTAAPDASSAAPKPSSSGKTLTEAELAEVALKTGELPDYAIAPLEGADERGTEESEDEACRPITAIINGSPEPAPTATVFRTAMDTTEEGKDDQTVVTEILTSHPAGGAEELLSSVRAAVKACAGGFRATSQDGPSTYTAVKALSAPRAGQDSFAYQVTGSLAGAKVPLVFHLVRTGSTVVTFYAADFLTAKTPEIPASLVTAQAAKLP
ncbi:MULTISPECIES: hypothetical protein [unclassified Streptomyces]|uniref:hypothetical protein n=1 Tax=unclassified Streptomyces TaxID=2593676 RepID=UPI00093D0255|nr:hypothetical protein [Streptomyces sp. CB02058]OKI97944.1 hypothetical protein AMK10_03810 [Streptomyces sp. CB02058]